MPPEQMRLRYIGIGPREHCKQIQFPPNTPAGNALSELHQIAYKPDSQPPGLWQLYTTDNPDSLFLALNPDTLVMGEGDCFAVIHPISPIDKVERPYMTANLIKPTNNAIGFNLKDLLDQIMRALLEERMKTNVAETLPADLGLDELG